MPTTQESQKRELKTKDIPGQIDPDVVIPASVKAAAARAEAAHKAAYPSKTAPDPAVTPAPASPPQATGTVREAGEPLVGALAPPAAQAPTDPFQQTLEQEVAKTPVQETPPQDNWEHRYTSMKGRYDKSQENIRQMAEQITNLQNVLATVSSTPPTSSVPATPKELQATSLLSPKEVEDYGEEFLNVVGKKAREAATPLVSSLQQKITELEQRLGYVGGSIAQNAKDRMLSSLDEQLPQWRDINNDKKFLQWLALPDAYSGAIRHNLLKAAWDRNDTSRSLAFFRGFLAEEAAVDPVRQQPNGSQAPHFTQAGNGQQSPQGSGKVPLEAFAAPGRAKSAAEIPAEKPLITRSQISKFYADCAAGKYRGNEAEKMRLENMIFAAQADGRITN